MKTPHKHAEVTIAWLQDQSIKLEYTFDGWLGWVTPLITEGINPISHPNHKWRIKPEPKPDVVRYGIAMRYFGHEAVGYGDNLKATFDGETGKLIKAEALK